MTDKQINTCEFLNICHTDCNGALEDTEMCHCYELYKQLKRKEQENEELKKQLQAQRDFTTHEQKLIYCVAYDRTCKTGNDCKQGKCIFKDNIKLKQTLAEIKEIAEYCYDPVDKKNDGFWTILQLISEVEND